MFNSYAVHLIIVDVNLMVAGSFSNHLWNRNGPALESRRIVRKHDPCLIHQWAIAAQIGTVAIVPIFAPTKRLATVKGVRPSAVLGVNIGSVQQELEHGQTCHRQQTPR
uniref:Uncharacterized protein n=1 Tax=Spongospora subterranea TaxID=70186 RepID=A0A0H5R1Q7_9EUKA|eukprot:CRZ08139.1 hypothetical protein [Spongospora subterranea]